LQFDQMWMLAERLSPPFHPCFGCLSNDSIS
jgi:hypothetical protein